MDYTELIQAARRFVNDYMYNIDPGLAEPLWLNFDPFYM